MPQMQGAESEGEGSVLTHISVSQSVRHPNGVAGLLAMPDPRVVGATPLDPGLKADTPVGVHRSPLFTMS